MKIQVSRGGWIGIFPKLKQKPGVCGANAAPKGQLSRHKVSLSTWCHFIRWLF
ncbi:hypothetical protein [Tabrizicola oligotrophica]|uniref:Uncharacterized protein n=1 Tax=Tabrizicola oligotrophica TaxID=2710650 RepID=A0A6M0QZL6_9RHOB|nr:hypothetical protein [Tabrizicola oligotrophica]NEY91982.1 hypothetical protein [Tabrizicola oligotrophica]